MKRLALLLLLLFWGSSIVYAGQNTIYENEIYRGYSKPYDQTDEFLSAGGSAKITVINGDMEDDSINKISSAVVKINGKIIFGSSSFNQKVDSIERIIDLQEGANILVANLKGKPGGKITITLEQESSTVGVIDAVAGGSITVEDPESAISGAKIEIPPGAADQDVEIVMAAAEIPEPLPDELIQVGVNVNIISNIESEFNVPVYLSIPYNDINNDGVVDGTTISEIRVGVKYFNGSSWEEVEVTDRDSVNNVVTVAITHFSNYVAYANGQAPVYDETQVVSDGAITVDGDGSDWASLVPGPVDPEDDHRDGSDSTWDIKHVYTAIDSQYAYLMIETYGGTIPVEATIETYINYKPGESFPWMPYADMGVNSHPNLTSFWNHSEPLDIQDYEISRGNVLELKIRLSEIENASYFNVITSKIWRDNWADVYDKFSFGPYMDFWIHSRSYQSGTSHCRILIELFDENNNVVHDDIEPKSITLTNLADMIEQPIYEDSTWEPWFFLFGRWMDPPAPGWHYDDTFTEGGDYYVDFDSLDAGNYRLRIIDQQDNKYERDYYYSGPASLPEVYPSVNDDNLFFDSEGNLHAYWNSPFWEDTKGSIRFYPFQDDGEPGFTAIWTYTYLDRGYVKVPAATLQKLYDRGGPFSIGVQVRSGDRSNRWYPEKVSLDSIPTNIPLKWQQPIMEDWTTQGSFDPIRWFPFSFNESVKITPETDSVSIETTVGESGQAFYVSKYELEDDFDIQIDFQIDNWPQTAEKGDAELSFQFGYEYSDPPAVSIGIAPSGGSLYDGTPTTAPRVYFSDWGLNDAATDDTSGKFRIERIGTTINTYYWDTQNGGWILLNTFDDIGPQPIAMSVHNWGWGENPGVLVTGAFSNFKRTN